MDKERQEQKEEKVIIGKRLNIARGIKNLTWQQLADNITKLVPIEGSTKFELSVSNIQKWQYRPIPPKWLFYLLKYFKVEEWVFTDETLNIQDFKKIVYDPSLMEKLKPAKETLSALPTIHVPLPNSGITLQVSETSLPKADVPIPAIDSPLPKIKLPLPEITSLSEQSPKEKGFDLKDEMPVSAKRLRSALKYKKRFNRLKRNLSMRKK